MHIETLPCYGYLVSTLHKCQALFGFKLWILLPQTPSVCREYGRNHKPESHNAQAEHLCVESSESREEVDALMHEGSYEEVDETLAYGNYGRGPLKVQF